MCDITELVGKNAQSGNTEKMAMTISRKVNGELIADSMPGDL